MERNDEKEREGDGIIYDPVSKKYICVLCRPGKSKNLPVDHRKNEGHVIRLQALYKVFVIRDQVPFCTSCYLTIGWKKVAEHARGHRITPYWHAPGKNRVFFDNYITRAGQSYYCHLCDRAMVHWSEAWDHLDNCEENHSELRKKAGEHQLVKEWTDRVGKWYIQGITPAPPIKLECRMCEVTMNCGEVKRHVTLSEHERRKRLFDESVAKRVKDGDFIRKRKTQQIPESRYEITSESSTCSDSTASSKSLLFERMESSDDDDESDDSLSLTSIESESSSIEENDSVTKQQCVEYHSLVLKSSWITETQHPQFVTNFPKNRRDIWLAYAAQGLHFCLLCRKDLTSKKAVKKHSSSSEHVNALKKYGTDYLILTEQGSFFCTCCEILRTPLWRIYKHMMTELHLKAVQSVNEEKAVGVNRNESKASGSMDIVKSQQFSKASKEENLKIQEREPNWIIRTAEAPKESRRVKINYIDSDEHAAKLRLVRTEKEKKAPIEETPRPASQSRNWLSGKLLGPEPQTSLVLKSCPQTARNLNCVIDRFHPAFPHRTVRKPHEKLATHTGDQIYHCLVCFVDFPDAQTTDNHISTQQHRNSLFRFGSNVIPVTPTPNYLYGFRQAETKTFLNMNAHLMSDQHTKIVRESSRQTALPFRADNKPRALQNHDNGVRPSFWDIGIFSFGLPTLEERPTRSYQQLQSSRKSSPDRSDSDDEFSRNFPKINSAPSTRRIAKKTVQHFEFRDEDLNWVVGSSHTLYNAKASKNLQEQSFYCLICSFYISGIEAAEIHISSQDHADSIKNFGCNFIQVTPDSKFHCACCNREKNRFYKIYYHVLSEAHMDRICEINQETGDKSPVELVAKESRDFETHDNDIEQSFSENSDPSSTGWPTFSERATTLTDETTSSSHEISSCIFVTRRNAKKSYCHICGSVEISIATKNLEDHINSMRHKFSLKKHGCENIEARKNGSYHCACCQYEISNLQNVYLHIKDKKHMSSLVKVKEESRRVRKVTKTVIPANPFKTTGNPLLSEFIVKKISEPKEIVNDVVYERLEDSRQNLLPRYTGNIKKNMDKFNSISGQLDNSNRRLLNSLQIADPNASALRDKWNNFQANKKRGIEMKPAFCNICRASVSSLEELHCHEAKHVREELVSMKNASLQKDSSNAKVTETHYLLAEFNAPENSQSANPSTNYQRNHVTIQNSDSQLFPILDDLTDSSESDQSSTSSFDDSSLSESDDELEEFDGSGRRPVWNRERYCKDTKETSSRKINLRKVLLDLNFKANYVYELKDKLKDLEIGSRLLLVIDEETIYCLVCREHVKNTLKEYSAHLWSLDHCSCLDLMEKDAAAFDEFADELSDLNLAHEYMEEISTDTVRCYLCNGDVENETRALRTHIREDQHKRAWAPTRSNGMAIFATLRSSVKCDWYGIKRYTCLACSICYQSDVEFAQHLNSHKHSKEMLKSPNVGRKMQIDYCSACAVMWFGYRSSYWYHVNEVDVHDWLTKDGFYLSRTIRKSVKELLQHPEDEVDRLIRHLDGIKADEKAKEQSLVDDLQKIVRPTFPRANAYVFGSRVTGLSSEDSDIDIFLDCCNVYSGKEQSDTMFFIDRVYKCLNKYPERWDVQEVLTRCRSPIIRLDHRPTGLACDISFDNGLTVEKTKFIRRIVEVYPPFRKLVLILKTWMARCDLSGSERIAHSSLYWLVLFFLQNEKILPSIAYLIAIKRKSHIIADCEVGVSHDFSYFEPEGETNFPQLLLRFFIFYANFDFRYDVACLLLGGTIQKRDFAYPETLPYEMRTYVDQVTKLRNPVEMFRIDSPMCIQDPFDLTHNVTKAVRKEVLNQFRSCCRESMDFMASL